MNKEKNTPRLFFEDQIKQVTKELSVTSRQIRNISIFRIIIFFITVIGIYIFSGIHLYALIATGILGFSVFVYLVIRHAKLYKEKKWFEALKAINETELALLEGKTTGIPGGEEYVDNRHPFTSDLDIFGEGSLFQRINRSATVAGQKLLAIKLSNPDRNAKELIRRQKAINELKNKPVWRQQFQAHGKLANDDNFTVENFLNWAEDTTVICNKLFYKFMLIITPVLGFGVILLISTGYLGFGAFLLFLILPFLVVGGKISMINKLHQQLGKKTETLRKFGDMFRMIESEQFTSELLVENKNMTASEGKSAHAVIENLSRITASFDYRLNILVGFFLNIFFLWDIRQCIRLEKWKKKYGHQMKITFNVLSQFDELASLAGFAFSHPDAVFPVFSENDFILEAEDARHPLINKEKNVGNGIDIHGWGKFQVVTGANMAGKSTYLRMVGVNMILAMTGAPVLAKTFKMLPVEVHTGIKTSDSLQDGESYFFAELKRLKEIITRLENGEQVFVLLDEILRGTNSVDKHRGSEGLLRQLVHLGASGMIATHDIALGELQKVFPEQIINKCFEVDIKNDELLFDYKIRDGISKNTNATVLMKKMGITV